MSRPPAVADVLRSLATVLGERGLRWYVFGAQAVLVYGLPRLTADVDVTIEAPRTEGNAGILEILAEARIVSRAPGFEAIVARSRLLPLVHAPSGIAVDVVLSGEGIEQDFLARVVPIAFGDVLVPVLSVEDLLATKVVAGRRKDRDDVLGILEQRAGEIDLVGLRRTLREFDEALEEPRASATFERILRAFKRKSRR